MAKTSSKRNTTSKKQTTPKTKSNGANSTTLKAGRKAPDFTLLSDAGSRVNLTDYRGKKVVLYFYPKDHTPGCTRQACAFRDGAHQLKRRGAVVLGVSADPVSSHRSFKQKHELNFPLLSDENKEMLKSYDVWRQKSLYGKRYVGLDRATFLINETGKISKVFPKVTVDGHFKEVLSAL